MPNDSTSSIPDVQSVRAKVRASLDYPKGAVDHSQAEPRYVKPPISSLTNLARIIGHDPAFFEHIGHNVFTDEVTWKFKRLTDEMETSVNMQIQEGYMLNMATERVREVIMVNAKQNPYHPVRDWLRGLMWDGVPRIDTLLSTYASADDTPLHRQISRKWMLSAIARVMEPGCKVDTMLILVETLGFTDRFVDHLGLVAEGGLFDPGGLAAGGVDLGLEVLAGGRDVLEGGDDGLWRLGVTDLDTVDDHA